MNKYAYMGSLVFFSNLINSESSKESEEMQEFHRLIKFWRTGDNIKKYTCKLFEGLDQKANSKEGGGNT